MIKVVLLDIEGTTTPVNFVYSKLFPYAAKALKEYLSFAVTSDELALVKEDYFQDESPFKPLWSDPPLAYLEWLMKHDVKARSLKLIQGKIWEEGYNKGALQGAFFEKVPETLLACHKKGHKLYIYSSGSVLAQTLIFKFNTFGDLTPIISGYFDTTIGSKKVSSSYAKISQGIGIPSSEIIFYSDLALECDAALEANMSAKLITEEITLVKELSTLIKPY
jgi:enolase-phosphatase E1